MLTGAVIIISGLAWHTDEGTLREKFEEFGQVEEAVSEPSWHPDPTPLVTSCSPEDRLS